jgi:hypothetical protein
VTGTTYFIGATIGTTTTYLIKAIDTSKNYSTSASTTTCTLVIPKAPTNIQKVISGTNLTLSWTASVQGTFQIDHYSIWLGTSTTPLQIYFGNVSGSTITLTINSSFYGTKRYTVIPWDKANIQGTSAYLDITIAAPKTSTVTTK